jgi:two-component system CheB/CheR fusion protein
MALGMVVHELATNALKYGALSIAKGHVVVTWSLAKAEGASRLVIVWREQDGPQVVPPTRHGFGTELITRTLAHTLDGEAKFDFAAAGLQVTLSIFDPALGSVAKHAEGATP